MEVGKERNLKVKDWRKKDEKSEETHLKSSPDPRRILPAPNNPTDRPYRLCRRNLPRPRAPTLTSIPSLARFDLLPPSLCCAPSLCTLLRLQSTSIRGRNGGSEEGLEEGEGKEDVG